MKMYQVDAFTHSLFAGNAAAVIVLENWLDDDLMQKIALENNLSETAFVKKIDTTHFEIRWFTPEAEVAFCGHATLASAFVLFRDYTSAHNIEFMVKDLGTFYVTQQPDHKISMNFPIRRAEKLNEYPALLMEALSKPIQAVYVNQQAYIVEYASVDDVMNESPNFEKLKLLGQQALQTQHALLDVAITAKGDDVDCVSRYFAPAIGINEDPVTGSIHTAIAPLWAEKLNKSVLTAKQGKARQGTLFCKMLDQERIEISGYAKLYMVAEIFVDSEF
ncbi:PhzF family phenazine biosynthesis protein [Acinetobacter sp. MD2(2019)]|uniref:PhzF family phenazine biosynthesis protein n=1 Tax=Acinetobacter sp. MD2(2019) TaxID=2605273 RepID=UPI002D1E4E30|nr:PhzF family phenazine biosynthesis protein [Acinetobacter sp. MD2(2019)]MEB3754079.1 PhzF family phenazine biosynthesis protein [Acinetobacter sp. MD2(2019)]